MKPAAGHSERGTPLIITALTSGVNVPSSRYRVRQHIDPLRRYGVDVREILPPIDRFRPLPPCGPLFGGVRCALHPFWKCTKAAASVPGVIASRRGALTWLERGLCPGFYTLEKLLQRPVILDVDDAVWLNRPFGRQAARRVAREAAAVIAGSAYLAEWFGRYARRVDIVPTAVDTDRLIPKEPVASAGGEPFCIGWMGTSGNFPYLYAIRKPLQRFLSHHGGRLLIVSDHPPDRSQLPDRGIRFQYWSGMRETAVFHQMDAGIMPLDDSPWARGKCSYKMLQYMAAGLPVVVSPVGMNRELLKMGRIGFAAASDAQWYDALATLSATPSLAAAMGREGRRLAEQHFSRRAVTRHLARIFREIA